MIISMNDSSMSLIQYKDSEIMTTKNKITSNEKIKKDLGFVQKTSIETGIKKTILWMKKYYSKSTLFNEIDYL